MSTLTAAVAALGSGPLTASALRLHIDPLFARVLARPGIYLANHSLGRPLDQTAADVAAGVAEWYAGLGDAWEPWLIQQNRVRALLAGLLGVSRADCIVPKTSAGQGLRAVLNLYDRPIQVLSTKGEFDSIDVILRHYAERGRIALRLVASEDSDDRGWFATDALLQALEQPTDLLVVSQVMFTTGQLLVDLPLIIAKAHARGARVLVDTYHGFGVVPQNLTALGADFAVGGGYKYLRGGPGSCWLYVHPSIADSGEVSLDTGWFAKDQPFTYQRPQPPRFAAGGDAFLESTPPVLVPYQAAAGLEFHTLLGIQRLREYGLASCQQLIAELDRYGIVAEGGRADMGAFVVIRHARAGELAQQLGRRGVDCDARGAFLRLTPDLLTRSEELAQAASIMAQAVAGLAPAGGQG